MLRRRGRTMRHIARVSAVALIMVTINITAGVCTSIATHLNRPCYSVGWIFVNNSLQSSNITINEEVRNENGLLSSVISMSSPLALLFIHIL